ncbi:hypothetical protein GS597_08375 [Synechococcales cyanobacterium C]|uniref:Chromophore lyase CpcT/CpeT n=1 Tax=Petrachloros mirabilis ULC683 TaxID=2781853 RepID=A0A8K1ZYN9_9CYAN|nr:chromophore lyase CpcT/CpeT [Petrachloros mirabilis]NCJ06526.1 hypothetical protein [Petrachloros mirabilis ULC683]
MTQRLLAQWLAGEFHNPAQALADPTWYVHLRWWHRPLPFLLEGNLALFAEQANILQLDQPYRQRVLMLQGTNDTITVQYFACQHPEQFRGAGADPARLGTLSPDQLQKLPGCLLRVQAQPSRFIASPELGCNCYFQYAGQRRQVVLGFEVSEREFWSCDRGIDPETGKSLWGAIMEPYQFTKVQDFGADLPIA